MKHILKTLLVFFVLVVSFVFSLDQIFAIWCSPKYPASVDKGQTVTIEFDMSAVHPDYHRVCNQFDDYCGQRGASGSKCFEIRGCDAVHGLGPESCSVGANVQLGNQRFDGSTLVAEINRDTNFKFWLQTFDPDECPGVALGTGFGYSRVCPTNEWEVKVEPDSDECGSCWHGQKTACNTISQGRTVVPLSCNVGTCFATGYDDSCPNTGLPQDPHCGFNPYEYTEGGVTKQTPTYCSMSCGGNVTVQGFKGCIGTNFCCANKKEVFIPSGKKIFSVPFRLCEQVGHQDSPAFQACDTCRRSGGIWTAVGCIPTDKIGMAKALVTLGLSIGGGVGLLLILAGAFMLTTSQGDPKKTEEGKELITSAIIGLLVITFSVSLLRLVGVDILRIPGFGQ